MDTTVADDPLLCFYFGYHVQLSAFEEKFGSYWGTIWVLGFFQPIVWLLLALGVGALNKWTLLVMVPALSLYVTNSILNMLVAPTAACPLDQRTKLVHEIFGPRITWLYRGSELVLYVSAGTWHVSIFFYPPLDMPVLAFVVVGIANVCALWGLAGIEIPMSQKDSKWTRFNRISMITGAWMEFATDFASGVTALNQGMKYFGIAILVAGCLEFIAVVFHTNAGLIAHNRKTLTIHALLEVPVLFLTVALMMKSDKPARTQVAHIVSITQTCVSTTCMFAWVFYLRPKWEARSKLQASGKVTDCEIEQLHSVSSIQLEAK